MANLLCVESPKNYKQFNRIASILMKYYKMSLEKDALNANAIEILRHLER
jgi:hypothetical protein